MNYVLINSGLGNQMFQYAFYLGLKAKGLRVQPLLSSKRTGHCGYELERVFDIRMPIGGGGVVCGLFSFRYRVGRA